LARSPYPGSRGDAVIFDGDHDGRAIPDEAHVYGLGCGVASNVGDGFANDRGQVPDDVPRQVVEIRHGLPDEFASTYSHGRLRVVTGGLHRAPRIVGDTYPEDHLAGAAQSASGETVDAVKNVGRHLGILPRSINLHQQERHGLADTVLQSARNRRPLGLRSGVPSPIDCDAQPLSRDDGMYSQREISIRLAP